MYFSSANCVIKLGPKDSDSLEELEDVVGVNVSETEQVLPIYGWRDREYSKVGKGNILVTGSIIYNANTKLYLESILLPSLYRRNYTIAGNTVGSGMYTVNSDLHIGSTAEELVGNMVAQQRVTQMVTDLNNSSEYDAPDLKLLLQVARLHKKYNYPKETLKSGSYNGPEGNIPKLSDVEANMAITNNNGNIYKISSITFNSTATEVQGGSASNIKLARGFIAKRFYEV
jgi:hypothetical protein